MSVLGFWVLPSTEVGQTPVVPSSPSPSEMPPLCSPLSCVVTYCRWFGERSLPGEFIVFSDQVHGALLHFCMINADWASQGKICRMSFCAVKLSGAAGLGPEQRHKKFSTLYKHICALPGWSGVIQMTAQRCYTKRASEAKPLSFDSRETILFIIPPAYCNTRPNFITCKNLRHLLCFEFFSSGKRKNTFTLVREMELSKTCCCFLIW